MKAVASIKKPAQDIAALLVNPPEIRNGLVQERMSETLLNVSCVMDFLAYHFAGQFHEDMGDDERVGLVAILRHCQDAVNQEWSLLQGLEEHGTAA